MERKYFKALNFDLDTHQLKVHYPGANYRKAYDDLRRFFRHHRFSHRQGSGYISTVPCLWSPKERKGKQNSSKVTGL